MASTSTAGFTHVGVAAAATLFVFWLTELPVVHKTGTAVIATCAGVLSGMLSARRIERSIDRRNGVVLYFTDTFAAAFLLPLGVLSVSSGWPGSNAVSTLIRSEGFQTFVHIAACGVATIWLAHDVVVSRRLIQLESVMGPLDVQWFYARSVVGPEGMIGKIGVVTTPGPHDVCVRIAGELWRAQSMDGSTLIEGQRVIVRRLDGLVVLVEAAEQRN